MPNLIFSQNCKTNIKIVSVTVMISTQRVQRNVHVATKEKYSWHSLSRTRLSRITAYLEVKILSLPKHENLTTSENIVEKRRISPLFHNIFDISLTSRVQLHTNLLNVVFQIIFSSILKIWYVEIRISRSVLESPLEFEITRVDCSSHQIKW